MAPIKGPTALRKKRHPLEKEDASVPANRSNQSCPPKAIVLSGHVSLVVLEIPKRLRTMK